MKKIICFLCLTAVLLLCVGCSASNPPVAETEPAVIETTEAIAATTAPTVPTEPTPMSTVELASFAKKTAVTVKITSEYGDGQGSGFFIDNNGTLVTNYHVIDGADSITVETSTDGVFGVEEIVDFSVIYDIAVLKINLKDNAYLEICDDGVQSGEPVYAIGSPLGLSATFSDGMVSNDSRKVGIIDCIQTTAPISDGNSGGPLLNAYGEVVGINAFSYISGENTNLAINIGHLKKLSMDKNWDVSRFREWFKKEVDRSYSIWDYDNDVWYLSKINTYQHVTGRECQGSAYSWEFKKDKLVVERSGYHDEYGVYCYEYDVKECDEYTNYLNEIGFVFRSSNDYTEGVSYYYENEFTGEKVDIFVVAGEKQIVVEAYIGDARE